VGNAGVENAGQFSFTQQRLSCHERCQLIGPSFTACHLWFPAKIIFGWRLAEPPMSSGR
jgi:hypothetical protein